MKSAQCNLHSLLSVIFVLVVLLVASPVRAETDLIEARLPYGGDSVRESMVVFSGETPQILPVSVSKTPQEIRLAASASQTLPGTLVAGVVVLADGTVQSSVVHESGEIDLRGESVSVAIAKEGELRERVAALRERAQSLEAELAVVNASVKKASGLDEVDATYAKAKALEEQAFAEERAIAVLRNQSR